jgi:predicted ATPase/class 3 adenylate cyclase
MRKFPHTIPNISDLYTLYSSRNQTNRNVEDSVSNYNETFGRLLKGAINSIAAYEGATAPVIEDELGGRIGVAGSAIQRYKSGYLPPDLRAVEILAEAAVRRGYLGRTWLGRFLQAARYPSPDSLVGRLIDGPTSIRSAAPALPAGTVTFLFTDIEGSTALWERHPQAMERALARHDAIVQQAIEDHSGHIIKTAGDGFCAAFATAADALTAALAAQRALAAEPWGSTGPIRVRMALHTGAAQLRDNDYYGPPLNRVARLLASGHGGQILLSAVTQELMHDYLLPDAGNNHGLPIQLRDLGAHRLKDLARPERIFQVVAPDLPADFPPLRTLDSYRHNLPPQPTALIGRDAEVRAVADLLCREDLRLLTLTGPGGVGKTRLALQAAAELLGERDGHRFADGVWFVALAPVRDPALVAAAIVQALDLKDTGDRPLIDVLKGYLRARRLLLVLDNFEQVAGATSLISDLLGAAPEVKLLITSRSALHLSGEHEFAVPPLRVPDTQHMPSPERMPQYEAVRLFIERAQAVRAGFSITNENAPAVAEICVRLDGLPLAIELAAARIRLFPPRALLARLGNRLKLLTGGARDLPARQQTLRDAIDWSYNLLDVAEQALFARLAVFTGGCALEAAEAVLGDDERDQRLDDELAVFIARDLVVDGLTSLVDKSLLRQIEVSDGEPRFVMLETIREYALERLVASGEEAAMRRRHVEYHLALAEASEPLIRQPGQVARMRREHDNLRAALGWAFDHRAVEQAARISTALWRYWENCGALSEGRAWLAAALARRDELPERLRAKVLCAAAELTENSVDEQALFEESLRLFRAHGDKAGIAEAVSDLGRLAQLRGDYAQARAYYDEKVALGRALGDRRHETSGLRSLASLALDEGDDRRAEALYQEALAIARTIEDSHGVGRVLIGLGMIAQRRGAYDQAAAHYAEGLALMRELEQSGFTAQALLLLAGLALQQGQLEQATPYYTESMELDLDRSDRWGGALCLVGFAQIAGARGQPERAARLSGAAEALFDLMRVPTTFGGRVENSRAAAAARAQIDEATFAAAFAAGRALSWEQAAEEALVNVKIR